MAELSKAEVEDVREVFDTFDFWDGRDGMVDASKIPDLLRCTGISPTMEICLRHGASKYPGEIQYTFEEFLSVYQDIKKETPPVSKMPVLCAFKIFDRESQGVISVSQIRHLLESYGERLSDEEVDKIFKITGLHDSNEHVKYEDFIEKINSGSSF